MENNIYKILNNFNKIASDASEPAAKEAPKAKTKLEESVEKVLATKYLEEKAKNPYAVGMAAAKKQAGITKTPAHNLPKKVVKKGHEIAKKIDEGVFGIDDSIKGKIQNIVSKLSDEPGNWDFKSRTFTDVGMEALRAALNNNPKFIKYALGLTSKDYKEGVTEGESCSCEETGKSKCPMHGKKLKEAEGTRKVKGHAYGAGAHDDIDSDDDEEDGSAEKKEAPRKRGRPPKGTPKKVVVKKEPGKRGRPMGSVKKPADPSKKYSVPANFGTMFSPKMAPSMTSIKSRKHKMIGESLEMEAMTKADMPPSMRKPVSLQTMNEPAVKTALPKLSGGEELRKSAPGMNPPVHSAFKDDDEELNELARLAGLPVTEKEDKTAAKDYDGDGEIESGKDEYLGSKIAAAKKAGKMEESQDLSECGMSGSMSPMGFGTEDNLSVSTSYNSSSGTKSITISAEGSKADALVQMLKLAGMTPGSSEEAQVTVVEPSGEEEVEEDARYKASTTPEEHVMGADALIHGGDGDAAGREKKMNPTAATWKNGDNAMAEAASFWGQPSSSMERDAQVSPEKKAAKEKVADNNIKIKDLNKLFVGADPEMQKVIKAKLALLAKSNIDIKAQFGLDEEAETGDAGLAFMEQYESILNRKNNVAKKSIAEGATTVDPAAFATRIFKGIKRMYGGQGFYWDFGDSYDFQEFLSDAFGDRIEHTFSQLGKREQRAVMSAVKTAVKQHFGSKRDDERMFEEQDVAEGVLPELQAKLDKASLKLAKSLRNSIIRYWREDIADGAPKEEANERALEAVGNVREVALNLTSNWNQVSDWIIDELYEKHRGIYNILRNQKGHDEYNWEEKYPGIKQALNQSFARAWQSVDGPDKQYESILNRKGQMNEFNDNDDDDGADPYKQPKPKHYRHSKDFFQQFEADHFDHEDFNKATGEFKGYWDDEQVASFKFDNPKLNGDEDPGMGWYYEPMDESVNKEKCTCTSKKHDPKCPMHKK